MRDPKKKQLEKRGWKVGTVQEFLDLTPEEVQYIEMKLRLSRYLREQRDSRGLTQAQLARRIRSSQSRVAKMEGGDPTVSVDLLIRSLLSLGVTDVELGRVIGKSSASAIS